MSNTLIIVPAYNEGASIGGVLADLYRELPDAEILVVDDGSLDDTAAQARAQAPAGQNLRVVRLSANLGIGGAVQTGLRYAVEQGHQRAVQVDGDGQHPAAAARQLLERLDAGTADVVIGSRFVPGSEGFSSTLMRRLGITILSRTLRMLGGPAILDVTSGLRAYGRRALVHLAARYPPDYPEPEALRLLQGSGCRIEEVPVAMVARAHGTSSISRLGSAFYMTRVLLGLVLLRASRRQVKAS